MGRLSSVREENVTSAIKALHDLLGPQALRAINVSFYEERTIFTIQDPKNPLHIDNYTYASGSLSDPVPATLTDASKLESTLFEVDSKLLQKARPFATNAFALAKVELGHVDGVTINKNAELMFVVIISGPRSNLNVAFDESGKRM